MNAALSVIILTMNLFSAGRAVDKGGQRGTLPRPGLGFVVEARAEQICSNLRLNLKMTRHDVRKFRI